MDFLQGIDNGNYYHWQHRQTPFLQGLAIVASQLGGYLPSIIFIVLTLGLLFYQGRTRHAWFALLFLLGGFFLVEVVRFTVHRPRPPMAEQLLGSGKSSSSFPSSTLFLAAMAWGLLVLAVEDSLSKRWMYWLVHFVAAAWVLLLGFCLFYLGLHFLSDAVASWALALVLLLHCRHWAGQHQPADKGQTP